MKFVIENPEKANLIGLKGKEVAIKFFDPIFQGKRLSEFYMHL